MKYLIIPFSPIPLYCGCSPRCRCGGHGHWCQGGLVLSWTVINKKLIIGGSHMAAELTRLTGRSLLGPPCPRPTRLLPTIKYLPSQNTSDLYSECMEQGVYALCYFLSETGKTFLLSSYWKMTWFNFDTFFPHWNLINE